MSKAKALIPALLLLAGCSHPAAIVTQPASAPIVTTTQPTIAPTTSTTEPPTTLAPAVTITKPITKPSIKARTKQTATKPVSPPMQDTTTSEAPGQATDYVPSSDTRGPGGNPWPITNHPAPGPFFIMTGSARWNPCAPIHYVTSLGESTRPDDLATIKTSFDVVAEATGMTFVYDGPAASGDLFGSHSAYMPDLYGQRFSPILVAVGSGLSAGIRGTSSPIIKDGVIVSGQVLLNATFGALPNVTMHELGHVMGLGHVDDYSQLMGEHSNAYFLGAGDLAGFKAQGITSGCVVTPAL